MSQAKSIKDLIAGHQKLVEEKNASKVKLEKPAPGKHRYRILPGWDADNRAQFWQYFGRHWVKVDGKVKAVAICREKTFNEPCPVCQAIGEGIGATDDDIVRAQLKQGNAQQLNLMNVIEVDGENPTEPFVLAAPQTVFDQIAAIILDYDDITDPDEGHDIVINRTGSGLDTTYTVVVQKSTPLPQAVRDKLNDLENLRAIANSDAPGTADKAVEAVLQVQGITLSAADTARPVAAPAREAISSSLSDELIEDADLVEDSVSEEIDDLEAMLDGIDED